MSEEADFQRVMNQMDARMAAPAPYHLYLWAINEAGVKSRRHLLMLGTERFGMLNSASPVVKAWYSHDLDVNQLQVPESSLDVVLAVLQAVGAQLVDSYPAD